MATPINTFPFAKEDRYIAIVGESWAEMLGQHAEYLVPKVGLFVHGENSDLRDAMSRMQVTSGNVEMAMLPLQQIMEVMIYRLKRHSAHKPSKEALISMELALEHIKRADSLLSKTI